MKKILLMIIPFILMATSIETAKKMYSDFLYMTGENNTKFQKMLQQTVQDQYWVKAVKTLKSKTDVYQTKTQNGKVFKMKVPKIELVLKHLYDSTIQNNNVLSAFAGETLIDEHLLFVPYRTKKMNKLIHKYMPVFAKMLVKHNYCYGYLSLTRYYMYFKHDINQAYQTAKQGFSICKSQKVPSWLKLNMRKEYAKTKVLKERHK